MFWLFSSLLLFRWAIFAIFIVCLFLIAFFGEVCFSGFLCHFCCCCFVVVAFFVFCCFVAVVGCCCFLLWSLLLDLGGRVNLNLRVGFDW